MISFCNLAVIVFKDMDSNSILHVVFYIHVTFLWIHWHLHKKWSFLRIWSHLLKKSLMENFIFYAVASAFTKSKSYEIKVNMISQDKCEILHIPNFYQIEEQKMKLFCFSSNYLFWYSTWKKNRLYHKHIHDLNWIRSFPACIYCSNLTKETLEQGVKYVQSWQQRHHYVVLVGLYH